MSKAQQAIHAALTGALLVLSYLTQTKSGEEKLKCVRGECDKLAREAELEVNAQALVESVSVDSVQPEDVPHVLAGVDRAYNALYAGSFGRGTLSKVEHLHGVIAAKAKKNEAEPQTPVNTEPPPNKPPEGTSLPEDFPGREALVKAGITTVESVRSVDDLTKVNGIGRATAEKIRATLT